MLNLSERCLRKDKRTALVDRDLLVEELSAPANLADDRDLVEQVVRNSCWRSPAHLVPLCSGGAVPVLDEAVEPAPGKRTWSWSPISRHVPPFSLVEVAARHQPGLLLTAVLVLLTLHGEGDLLPLLPGEVRHCLQPRPLPSKRCHSHFMPMRNFCDRGEAFIPH